MTRDTPGSLRVRDAFATAASQGRIAFVPYVVAGYPDAGTSEAVALAAIDAGADILELGLPYSDPLADGATVQRASAAALAAGATLESSLRLLERVCAARPDVPVFVMGYVNQFLGPVGADAISRRLAETGAAGAIVPDLTPDEGAALEDAFVRHGLALVYLVAPTTPSDRAAAIAARGGGFLYLVSLAGVTGARSSLPASLKPLVTRVKSVSSLPVAVGFGVSRPAHVRGVARTGADGVVVGSALVDALGPAGNNVHELARLCRQLRGATELRPPVDERHHVGPRAPC